MRVVRCEKIFLSQNEADTWTKFIHLLDGLERESNSPSTLELINDIQVELAELWEKIEDVE